MKVASRFPKAEQVVAFGEPWRQIIDCASERNVDLIVMGTHGRKGLAQAFLGSVAERVVRFSPVPVLTVPRRAL